MPQIPYKLIKLSAYKDFVSTVLYLFAVTTKCSETQVIDIHQIWLDTGSMVSNILDLNTYNLFFF